MSNPRLIRGAASAIFFCVLMARAQECTHQNAGSDWTIKEGPGIRLDVSARICGGAQQVVRAPGTTVLGAACPYGMVEFRVEAIDKDEHVCEEGDVFNYLEDTELGVDIFVRSPKRKIGSLGFAKGGSQTTREWTGSWEIPEKVTVDGEDILLPGRELLFEFTGRVDDAECPLPSHTTSWDSEEKLKEYDATLTVAAVDLVAYKGKPVEEISDRREEDPGAYVAWNADGSNKRVKLELRTNPALPATCVKNYKLRVESVGGGSGRIKVWQEGPGGLTPLIEGIGEATLALAGKAPAMATLWVDGTAMSSAARDVKVTFRQDGCVTADTVFYSVVGIEPVKSREDHATKLDFVPLVRKSYEIATADDVRTKAAEMSWAIHLFQPEAGTEAGATLETYDAAGSRVDSEQGDFGELDVEGLSEDHYVGWDGNMIFPNKYRGYAVDTLDLSTELNTVRGAEGGMLWLRSTEGESANGIEEFGNNRTKVLASNLILKPPAGGSEVFDLLLKSNDDDDDRNGHPDNADEAITGSDAQKAEDRQDMAQVTIAKLLPDAARAGATFTLTQGNAGAANAGRVRLFKTADDAHYWTSGAGAKDLTADWAADLALRLEGVEPGEVILKLEYEGNDVKWFDKAKVTVVRIDLQGYDAFRANDGDMVPESTEDSSGVLVSVNDDGGAPDPLECKIVARSVGVASGFTRTLKFSDPAKIRLQAMGGAPFTPPAEMGVPGASDADATYEVHMNGAWNYADSVQVDLVVNDAAGNEVGRDIVKLVIVKTEIVEMDFKDSVDDAGNALDNNFDIVDDSGQLIVPDRGPEWTSAAGMIGETVYIKNSKVRADVKLRIAPLISGTPMELELYSEGDLDFTPSGTADRRLTLTFDQTGHARHTFMTHAKRLPNVMDRKDCAIDWKGAAGTHVRQVIYTLYGKPYDHFNRATSPEDPQKIHLQYLLGPQINGEGAWCNGTADLSEDGERSIPYAVFVGINTPTAVRNADAAPTDPWQIVTGDGGFCNTWALLMRAALRVAGVPAERLSVKSVVVMPPIQRPTWLGGPGRKVIHAFQPSQSADVCINEDVGGVETDDRGLRFYDLYFSRRIGSGGWDSPDQAEGPNLWFVPPHRDASGPIIGAIQEDVYGSWTPQEAPPHEGGPDKEIMRQIAIDPNPQIDGREYTFTYRTEGALAVGVEVALSLSRQAPNGTWTVVAQQTRPITQLWGNSGTMTFAIPFSGNSRMEGRIKVSDADGGGTPFRNWRTSTTAFWAP